MNFTKKIMTFEKKYLVIFWGLNLFLTLIALFTPLLEGKMLNVLVYSKDINIFRHLIFIFVFLLILQLVIKYFINKIETIQIHNFILVFNRKILNYLFKVNTLDVLQYNATYLHSRLIQDTDSMIRFFYSSISSVINNSLILIFTAVVLYRVNKYLLLLIILFLPIYTLIYYVFKEKIKFATFEQMEAGNSCFSNRNNIYINYLEIKSRERQEGVDIFLQKKENRVMLAIKRMFYLNFSLSSIQFTVNSFFQVGCFIIGGIAVMQGYITMGVFAYLLQYFVMLLNTIDKFFNIGTAYQEYQASIMRLKEILNIEKEHNGAKILTAISSIELADLNYKFNNRLSKLYAYNVNLQFVPGKIYHLVGTNGAGKSTILSLILGIYRDKNLEGSVLFNGLNLSELDMITVRKKNISFMPQYNISFDGTVREYIDSMIEHSDYDGNKFDETYQKLFFSDKFNIDTILDKEYSTLSGGEQQLLNLFLCLVKKASAYILDEPISNIFPELKQMILSLLDKKAKSGNIVILVAHDKDIDVDKITYTLS